MVGKKLPVVKRWCFVANLAICVWMWVILQIWVSPVHALNPHKSFEEYRQHVWDTEAGLPHNTITAILQSHTGYLWLGTYEGLVRFDGFKFKVFKHQTHHNFKNNDVTTLYEDATGTLWIGTRGGLIRYRNAVFTTFTVKDGLADNYISAITADQHGVLWIGTRQGINKFTDDKIIPFPGAKPLAKSLVWSLVRGYDNTLWIGTNGSGLWRFVDGKFTIFTRKDGLSSNVIRTLYEDTIHRLWIGTADGGLNLFQDGIFTKFNDADGLSNNSVRTIYQDKRQTLWIGTSGGGLNRLIDGKITSFTALQGLSNDVVWSIFEDREENLWVGTAGGGLNQLTDGKFTTYTTKDGLTSNFIWSVYEDQNSAIWLGTNGGGVNILKDKKWTALTTEDGLSSNFIRSVYGDRNGGFWFGTGGHGVNHLRANKTITNYTTQHGLAGDVVYAIYQDRAGGIWFGTDEGVSHLNAGKFVNYTVADGLAHNVVRFIHQDRNGNFWFGTNGGLNRLKNGKFTLLDRHTGLPHERVLSIHEDTDAIIWIGTRGGLARLNNNHLTVYTENDGLFNDLVFQILEDNKGYFWMSCNSGVFQVSKRQLNDFADGKIEKLHSRVFGKSDGLKTNEFNGGNQPAGWKSHNGNLWFPTIKGIAMIDPQSAQSTLTPPTVLVERFVVDAKAEQLIEHIQLAPGKKTYEFHYTALSFYAPKQTIFSYQLEGFDATWVNASTRRIAYYTNLQPGRYSFRVRAKNNEGVWSIQPAITTFTLQPYFFQTIPFYIITIIIIIMLIVGVYTFRVRQLKAREKLLESLVQKRTSELQEANRKLELLSIMDGLTGVFNRRHFNAFLDHEWKRAVRENAEFSLIMIDIDYFKVYNDTYGHQGGDDCLKQVASVMQVIVNRSSDLVARYGGEEFSIVLPNTDAMGAWRVAEAVRSGIENLHIDHKNSKACPYVTISLGVATCLPSTYDNETLLIADADKALYQAKQEGRNRISTRP